MRGSAVWEYRKQSIISIRKKKEKKKKTPVPAVRAISGDFFFLLSFLLLAVSFILPIKLQPQRFTVSHLLLLLLYSTCSIGTVK